MMPAMETPVQIMLLFGSVYALPNTAVYGFVVIGVVVVAFLLLFWRRQERAPAVEEESDDVEGVGFAGLNTLPSQASKPMCRCCGERAAVMQRPFTEYPRFKREHRDGNASHAYGVTPCPRVSTGDRGRALELCEVCLPLCAAVLESFHHEMHGQVSELARRQSRAAAAFEAKGMFTEVRALLQGDES